MRIYLICLIFIFSNGLYGQFYGHKLFSLGNNNLNAVGIFIDSNNDRIIVPTIYYPGDTSTIITFDQEGNNRFDIEIPNFVLPKSSFVHLDGHNYFYGKNDAISNNLEIIKLDSTNQVIWQHDFQTDLDYSFPNDIVTINQELYITSVIERTEPFHRRLNVKKIDRFGDELWSRNFNSASYISYPSQAIISSDNHFLLSATLTHQQNVQFRRSQIMKINSLGNVVWEVLGTEKTQNGVRATLAELSNNNLVQLYEVNKFDDFEYRSVYNPFPVRMDWYDADGNFLFYKYIEYPNTEQFERGGVVAGNGDYFFVTGSHSDNNIPVERYGVVTKFNNQGDTIWTKQYYHPDYPTLDDFRFIRNLVEVDNGDLLLMGMTEGEGGYLNAWFMRVNEHGCFGTTTCEDLVTSTETELNLSLLDIKIFPNPATDILQITSAADRPIQSAKLYDFSGQTLMEMDLPNNGQSSLEISVAELPEGNYVLSLELKDGRVVTEMVRVADR